MSTTLEKPSSGISETQHDLLRNHIIHLRDKLHIYLSRDMNHDEARIDMAVRGILWLMGQSGRFTKNVGIRIQDGEAAGSLGRDMDITIKRMKSAGAGRCNRLNDFMRANGMGHLCISTAGSPEGIYHIAAFRRSPDDDYVETKQIPLDLDAIRAIPLPSIDEAGPGAAPSAAPLEPVI